jgi:choice-of-anchor C domain-containing protein
MHRCSFVFALVAVCAAADASIVVNGGFEQPPIGGGYQPVSAGDPFITGWTVTSGQVDLVHVGFGAFFANSGSQGIDMAGSPGPGSIAQDLPTIPGEPYLLSFYTSSNGGPHAGAVTLAWDGDAVDTISTTAYGTWVRHDYMLVASDASTTLEFIGNIPGSFGAMLDDVSVTLVPTPGAAIGLATLGFLPRRRRR